MFVYWKGVESKKLRDHPRQVNAKTRCVITSAIVTKSPFSFAARPIAGECWRFKPIKALGNKMAYGPEGFGVKHWPVVLIDYCIVFLGGKTVGLGACFFLESRSLEYAIRCMISPERVKHFNGSVAGFKSILPNCPDKIRHNFIIDVPFFGTVCWNTCWRYFQTKRNKKETTRTVHADKLCTQLIHNEIFCNFDCKIVSDIQC